MFWKIYTVLFFVINAVSLIVFDYSSFSLIPFFSLVLSSALNLAVFSYAFNKPLLSKQLLIWLFKANIGLFGLFLSFEFLTFIQEVISFDLLRLPTSGVVSIIASFPSLPALYATYKMAYPKPSKSKKKSKKKS
jgi:hypothetical protein